MTTDFFTSPTLPLDVGPDINVACNLDLACDARNAGAGSLSLVAGWDAVPCGGVVFACAVLFIQRFFGFLRSLLRRDGDQWQRLVGAGIRHREEEHHGVERTFGSQDALSIQNQ